MNLGPGETKGMWFEITVPRGHIPTVDELLDAVVIQADCSCGERLMRVGRNVWGCPKEPWYHRFIPRWIGKPFLKQGHARLIVQLGQIKAIQERIRNDQARPN